ncbi:DMT family transporter [Campylobacter gracilis]|uniref:Putative membrane protein n=1 Tax=Campylobacter gracilis RM3268 TaxID=553220 RepID=C8PKI7_9BACT|nr:DMT family transporter [Campylobacter gracilis]AKT93533.1 putative membrane protein, putative permease (EamA domain), type 5 [Campylobacter gracilis]EEV16596.1 putative membrane protein [Campylobacter gracilis RM3268]UEB46358.1 DMT family transporter [Campylobacter gracilis]SUW78132.1 permeases of the drug/metabolite transporter [Campylobacter gracilis]
MKNSISELAENFNSKSALNFATLSPNLKSAQIPSCAESKALNSVKVSTINLRENSARNFRRNFILHCTKNFTCNGANSASSLSRASAANDPNLSSAKSLAAAHTRRYERNFTWILANDPGAARTPRSFEFKNLKVRNFAKKSNSVENSSSARSLNPAQNFDFAQSSDSTQSPAAAQNSASAQNCTQGSNPAQSRTQNPAPPSRLWDLGLLFVAIVWGCTFVPVQRALHSGDVFSFLFWRFLAASIFTYLACLRFGVKFDRGTIERGVFCGLMLFCDFSCQTIALDYALSSTVAFILGLNVVIVPFLMLAFFGKKVGPSAFGGAVVALLGLYLLSGASGAVGFGIGERLTLVSAFAYALHIVFTGVCARKSNLYGFVIVQFICVCVCALIAAVFVPHAEFEGEIKVLGNLIFSPDFDFVFALVLTSIFATVAAFVIQTMAQNRGVSEIKTVLIFALEPVGAGIMGYAFGEKLSALQILGAALILAGILLSELGGLLGAKFAKDRACEKAD